jgi:integrase
VLLESFYETYFEPLKLRGRADNTRRLYRTTLRTFGKFLTRPPELNDLTDDTVSRFLDWFLRLPRSPFSANKERSNLLAIWRFACRKNFVDHWPDVEPDAEPERIPQAWTAAQIAQLLAACNDVKGTISGVPACLWWRTLHLVAWDTGERIGGIRDLRWSHVDRVGGWVLVPAELRKGGKADRIYRLADDTLASLAELRAVSAKYVFPWPYSRNYLWNRYGKLLRESGLPHDRSRKFHCIRRSVASHYEAAGGNATTLLGHSGRKVTMAYLDPRIVKPESAIDRLFRPGGKAS